MENQPLKGENRKGELHVVKVSLGLFYLYLSQHSTSKSSNVVCKDHALIYRSWD